MAWSTTGQYIMVGTWVPTTLSGTVLLLRIYCKQVRQRGLWWDDALLTLAWILLLVSNVIQTIEIPLGFGAHLADVPADNLPLLGLLDEVTATLTALAAAWSKTAFAMTLALRIDITSSSSSSSSGSGWARTSAWLVVATVNASMLLSVALGWAQCSPPAKELWRPELPGTWCVPPQVRTDYDVYAGAYAGVMDLCLAALPWTILPKLQMTAEEKIGVGFAMSMGVLAGAAAFAKCAVLPALSSGDFTFFGADIVVWSTVEIAVTIIACSIPTLRALLLMSDPHSMPHKRSSTHAARTSRRATRTGAGAGAAPTHDSTRAKGSARRGAAAVTSRGRNTSWWRRCTGSAWNDEEGSDAGILPVSCAGDWKGGIVRTAEVTIEYSSRRDEDGLEMTSFNKAYLPGRIY